MEKDHSVLHAWKRCDAAMLAVEGKFGVDFVTDHEKILVYRNASDPLQSGSLGNTACRIGGEIQQQGLATWFPSCFEGGGIESEVVVRRGRNANGLAMDLGDAGVIRNVARLVMEYLVARIHDRSQSEIQGLGNTDCDQDLVLGVIFQTELFFDVF